MLIKTKPSAQLYRSALFNITAKFFLYFFSLLLRMAAGCLLRDRLEELWLHIDQLHLTYLQADESPRKLEEKKRLEGNVSFHCSIIR